jgi:hypothetical protein
MLPTQVPSQSRQDNSCLTSDIGCGQIAKPLFLSPFICPCGQVKKSRDLYLPKIFNEVKMRSALPLSVSFEMPVVAFSVARVVAVSLTVVGKS